MKNQRVTNYCPHCGAEVRFTKLGLYRKHKLYWSKRKVCPISGQSTQVSPPDIVISTWDTPQVIPTNETQAPRLDYTFNDGGRSRYREGSAGDCVTRAISIATGIDYDKVWRALKQLGCKSPDEGCHKRVWSKYLKTLGFKWVSCKGRGRTNQEHVPTQGVVILRQRRHLCAVVDGTLHDTHETHNKSITGYYLLT